MSLFRFVHMADVHLDAPFASRKKEVRDLLRHALHDSFRAAVRLALGEKVDALLVAGDLFDTPEPSLSAERFLLEELRRLGEAGIAVFTCSGNHDPGGARSGLRRIPWPENVTLFFDPRPERKEVRRPGGEVAAHVTGAGHDSPALGENLAALFPAATGPLPEVALLHASVEGSNASAAHDRYAPCGASDLRRGYDYWALGHIHLRQQVGESPAAFYPGSLLGRSRKETGDKGVLLVEASRGAPARALFHRTSSLTWEEVAADISSAENADALRQIIVKAASRSAAGGPVLLTVRLEGASPLKELLDRREELERLEEDLAGEVGLPLLLIRTGGLTGRINPAGVRIGPLGSALDLVERLRSGEESLDTLFSGPLAGLTPGDAEEKRRYLLSLLENAEEEIISRVWKEGQ